MPLRGKLSPQLTRTSLTTVHPRWSVVSAPPRSDGDAPSLHCVSVRIPVLGAKPLAPTLVIPHPLSKPPLVNPPHHRLPLDPVIHNALQVGAKSLAAPGARSCRAAWFPGAINTHNAIPHAAPLALTTPSPPPKLLPQHLRQRWHFPNIVNTRNTTPTLRRRC